MKTAKLFIPLVLLAVTATAQQHPANKAKAPATAAKTTAPVAASQLPTDGFYEHFVLKHAETPTPDGYGFSPEKPIPVGAYEEDLSDEKKINAQLNRFVKTYLWADGTPVIFLGRQSQMINNVNYDLFRITKTGTKDTLTLYADMYKAAPVGLPKGFRFYTKAELAAEVAPAIAMIKAYDATPDKYADAKAKASSFQILGFLQQNIGLDYLMDNDYLAPILNDVGIDLDLKAFLIRSYISHKFEYEATGVANAQVKAFNTLVDDYQVAIKTHDIFAKGNLPTTLVKK
jgi:hypothetical protein